jgi:phosphate starvation-inducible PhoH-like protein
VTGQPADNAFAVAVFDELIALLGTGQALRPDSVRRVIGMLRAGGSERPADVLSLDIISRRGPHDPAQDAEPEALRRRDRRAHHRLRHRPGRHRQDLPGDGQGRAGAADQAGQPDHPHPPAVEAGERLGYLPGSLSEKIDPYLRPLYDALHDMVDPSRSRG